MIKLRFNFVSSSKTTIVIVVTTLMVLVVFSVLALMADRQAMEQHKDIFNDHRSLQASLLVQGIQDRVDAILADESRIADVRIPELIRNNKIDNLPLKAFAAKMKIYPEIRAYVYMDGPKSVAAVLRDESKAGVKAESLCLQWGASFWSELSVAGKGPIVPFFYVTNSNQIVVQFLPVRVQGEFSGVLAVAVSLEDLAKHYGDSIYSSEHGSGFLIDELGNIVYSCETQTVGSNVFTGVHSGNSEFQKFDKRILNEVSGSGEYAFPDMSDGQPVHRFVVWNTVQIGERKLVICLTAPIEKVGETVHSLGLQRMVLGGGMALIFLAAFFVFFQNRSRLRLQESEGKLRTIVENSTNLFYSHTPERVITYVSPQSMDILGYTQEEMLFEWTNLASDNPINEIGFKHTLSAIETGLPQPTYGLELVHKNGGKIWVEIREAPVLVNKKVVSIVGVLTDVTERKQAEEKLLEINRQLELATERANKMVAEAEAANKAKSEFLANMSHEIRTPLNGVLGMLQLMQTTALNDEQKEYSQTAIQSTKRLTRLLSDILDLSRVEAGKLNIQAKPFDLAEALRQVIELFRITSMQSGVKLRWYIDPVIPQFLVGDAIRVQQLFSNLLGNAFKFTETGSITVEAYPLPAHSAQYRVLFSVSDTGIGIADDKLEKVFESFTQVSEGYSRSYQGAGLGLAICKRLVGLMGGNMAIASEVGEGTSVYFCITFNLVDKFSKPSKLIEDKEVAATKNLKILLADDDRVSRFVAKRQLEKAGHKVTDVEDGQQVLNVLQADKVFDVVLMDVQMPIMDGVEATLAIREGQAGERNRQIPIIALTAYAMNGDNVTFMKAGMDEYASKPVEMEMLSKVMSKAIGKAHKRVC